MQTRSATATAQPHPGPLTPSLQAGGGFAALLVSCRATGGLVPGDALASLLQDQGRGDTALLARWIVSGQVFGFACSGDFWLPMFQFDLRDMRLRRSAQQVRAALDRDQSGWEMATWFAWPNFSLGGRRPVDLLDHDLPAVLGAARADHRLARV
jgi:hypothetical protein